MTLHSILIQKLLSTNAHLGKSAASSHQLKQFAYGIRNSQSIIDSDKTLICLRHAIDFIAALARDRHSRFLFVNTNPIFNDVVECMTRTIGLHTPRDNIIWRKSGFLTNSFSPKKFKSRNKKFCLGLAQHPDCVVVVDTELKSSVIREADRMQIPIVALVDPSMPLDFYKKVTYPVPANHSMEFVYLFCNIVTKTILLEKKKLKGLKDDTNQHKNVPSNGIERKESKFKNLVQISSELLVLPFNSLDPVPDDSKEVKKNLGQLAFVQFNESLGTCMGYKGPLSTLEIRDGMTSLDFSLNRIKMLNSKYGCLVPVVLMNSKSTEEDTKKVLEHHDQTFVDMILNKTNHPLEEQATEPIDASELRLADHASRLLSLVKNGSLDFLLEQGKEIAYVCSAENVAPSIDFKILNCMIEQKFDCCIEVVDNPTWTPTNNLSAESSALVEIGSISSSRSKNVPENARHVDTGNMWINLKSLKLVTDGETFQNLDEDRQQSSGKTSPHLFDNAAAVVVPPSHVLPLNSTSDLLLLQSDLFSVQDGALLRNPARKSPRNPSITVGREFEEVSDFHLRFKSIPSVVDLDSLKVEGDVWFGSDVTLKGTVSIIADSGTRIEIPDGAVLHDREIADPSDL